MSEATTWTYGILEGPYPRYDPKQNSDNACFLKCTYGRTNEKGEREKRLVNFRLLETSRKRLAEETDDVDRILRHLIEIMRCDLSRDDWGPDKDPCEMAVPQDKLLQLFRACERAINEDQDRSDGEQ